MLELYYNYASELTNEDCMNDKLFTYEDYRKYIKDFLEEKRRLRSTFSARYFSKIAGFTSSNYCSLIVTGKRNLTLKSLPNLVKALKLKGREIAYFENLVQFNQSKSIDEQKEYYRELEKIRKSSGYVKVEKDQSKFFYHWYYPVVREVATTFDWKDDYTLLASKILPKISRSEAEEAVNFLVDTAMITKDDTGIYHMANEYVIDENIQVFIKAKGRKEVLNLGIDSCETMSAKERYTTVSTYQLSKEGYAESVEAFEVLRDKISEIVRNDSGNERAVYELVNQMFPVSKSFNSMEKL